MTPRSILIVAPHPDDETLGCGGTLARRAEEGHRITVVVVTDGRHLFRLSRWKIEVDPTPAEASAMRKDETRRAVAILAGEAATIRFLDVEDATLARHVDIVAATLAAIIREVTPDEVYVTSQHEEHPDHVAACAAVREAMRATPSRATLYRYIIALRRGLSPETAGEPTVAADIAPQQEKKRRAVSQFASHLTIVGRGQTAPFFAGVEPWVRPVETFFVDSE
jgi:LmbE family N-acetylglucosaminyl deacetylase